MTPDKPPMKTYVVPEPLLQEVFAYLKTRPWGEVNGMIANILQLVQAETNAQQNIVMPPTGNGRDKVAEHPTT